MNGVVLWSDANQHKAVIWCEDQGELAFYSQKLRQSFVDLHEGDLICFDLTLQHNLRMAENLQVVEEAACLGLAHNLTVAEPDTRVELDRRQNTAQVIPFAVHAKQKQRENDSRRNRVG